MTFKKSLSLAVASATLLIAASAANAESSTGTLTVTGTVESAINLTIESAGGTTSGTGAAVTSALGSINKYGGSPTGFALAKGASDWTLSSTVDVKVEKANLTSSDYTLVASLESAPATGVAWKLGGNTLSADVGATLTSTGTYALAGSYSWDIVVADSAAAAAIDNAITFTATSN